MRFVCHQIFLPCTFSTSLPALRLLYNHTHTQKKPKSSLLVQSTWLINFFFFFCLFKAASVAYGDSQARGLIGAVAAALYHSHSNAGSQLHLRPTPQVTAMPDP